MKFKQNYIFFLILSALIFLPILSSCNLVRPANENAQTVAENKVIVTNANSNLANKQPPTIDKKITKDIGLQKTADGFLPLFKMPSVPIYVKDEPIIKGGSETQKGVGYTTCENKKEPTIYIKKVFFDKANKKMLANIVKHEMVHAWFCRQGEIIGHDERFRKKFKEIGGVGN